MNDAELRRLALQDRDDTLRALDTEADLATVRGRIASGGGGDTVSVQQLRAARRPWPLLLGAAAVIVLVVAAVVVIRDGDEEPAIRTNTPEPSPLTTLGTPIVPTTAQVEPATTVAEVAPTTSDTVAETAATTAPPTTIEPAPTGGVIAVDYTNPPPLIEPIVLASVPILPDDDNPYWSFAIGEREIAVRQRGADFVTLVDRETAAAGAGGLRDIALDEEIDTIVLGPGDVVYGFGEPRFEPPSQVPIMRFVAIPLSGDRSGEVIAAAELGAVAYTELPPGAFGHGSDGVIDRVRDVNQTIIGYVDVDGQPLAWSGPEPLLVAQPFVADTSVIQTADGSVTWDLDITRSPNHGGEYEGPHPPAPTTGGRVIYVDSIGDDLTPDSDFGPSAMPVIAILQPDGSGQWVRLPDDWRVVASDVWGTVLMLQTDDSIELAMLDDALAATTPQEPTHSAGGLAVAHRCLTAGNCTQLVTADGSIIAYDPVDNTLTTLDVSGTEVRGVVQVADPVVDRSPRLVAAGPDGVTYFLLSSPADAVVDLVAVPTSGALAGTIIEVAAGLDGSGDTDLVPTTDGLAEVGCCGSPGEFARPAPDATVHHWVDSTGAPITSSAVSFEIGVGESVGLTRIDPSNGGRTLFELPGVAVDARGMPPIVATDDGGALMHVFDPLSLRQYLVRFATDWPEHDIDSTDVVLLAEDPALEVMLLESAGTVIVREGDRLVRHTTEELGTPGWPGRLQTDPEDIWVSTAPGLNDFIEANQPEWASDPLLLARQLVPRTGPNEHASATYDESSSVLTMTTSGFLDDSVLALQREIVLELADDGLYRFVSGTSAQQCQPGRGHQDFRPEVCT